MSTALSLFFLICLLNVCVLDILFCESRDIKTFNLFDGSKLVFLVDGELKKCCLNFEFELTNDQEYDI